LFAASPARNGYSTDRVTGNAYFIGAVRVRAISKSGKIGLTPSHNCACFAGRDDISGTMKYLEVIRSSISLLGSAAVASKYRAVDTRSERGMNEPVKVTGRNLDQFYIDLFDHQSRVVYSDLKKEALAVLSA